MIKPGSGNESIFNYKPSDTNECTETCKLCIQTINGLGDKVKICSDSSTKSKNSFSSLVICIIVIFIIAAFFIIYFCLKKKKLHPQTSAFNEIQIERKKRFREESEVELNLSTTIGKNKKRKNNYSISTSNTNTELNKENKDKKFQDKRVVSFVQVNEKPPSVSKISKFTKQSDVDRNIKNKRSLSKLNSKELKEYQFKFENEYYDRKYNNNQSINSINNSSNNDSNSMNSKIVNNRFDVKIKPDPNAISYNELENKAGVVNKYNFTCFKKYDYRTGKYRLRNEDGRFDMGYDMSSIHKSISKLKSLTKAQSVRKHILQRKENKLNTYFGHNHFPRKNNLRNLFNLNNLCSTDANAGLNVNSLSLSKLRNNSFTKLSVKKKNSKNSLSSFYFLSKNKGSDVTSNQDNNFNNINNEIPIITDNNIENTKKENHEFIKRESGNATTNNQEINDINRFYNEIRNYYINNKANKVNNVFTHTKTEQSKYTNNKSQKKKISNQINKRKKQSIDYMNDQCSREISVMHYNKENTNYEHLGEDNIYSSKLFNVNNRNENSILKLKENNDNYFSGIKPINTHMFKINLQQDFNLFKDIKNIPTLRAEGVDSTNNYYNLSTTIRENKQSENYVYLYRKNN